MTQQMSCKACQRRRAVKHASAAALQLPGMTVTHLLPHNTLCSNISMSKATV